MKQHTYLAILQQAEYELPDFTVWFEKHRNENADITPDKWTAKLKLIAVTDCLLFWLPTIPRIKLIVATFTWFEQAVRSFLYARAHRKLMHLKKKGLKVVAIAGSFGKTSTKNIANHLLSDEYSVLATPKSINTLLGISSVIWQDLHSKHDVFIVEFGEFFKGDIAQMTALVDPDYVVITPIGHQHLSRFGSVEAIAENIAGAIEYYKKSKLEKLPVCIHHTNYQYYENTWFASKVVWYGEKSPDLTVKNATVSRRGTEYTVTGKVLSSEIEVFSPLFGEHQAVNTLPGAWLLQELTGNINTLKQRIATLPYITRRHEPHFAQNDVLVLDNSYNTNPDSFPVSLALLNQLQPSKRIVITLGYVELGEENEKHHTKLGQLLAKNADYVGLISSDNSGIISEAFKKAGGDPTHLITAETPEAAMTALQKRIEPGSIVLFEGGYRELLV